MAHQKEREGQHQPPACGRGHQVVQGPDSLPPLRQRHGAAMDSRMEHPVTWKCPACDYFLPLPDEEFKHRVFLLQQRLVAKPLLTEKEEEIPVTSMEARRLTNEIFRKLDSGVYSEDELVNLALQCAAKNYEAISSARHITDRLTATLLHAGPLSAFDRTLFERTVSEIHLTRKGEILLKLQNGVFIGEGDAP